LILPDSRKCEISPARGPGSHHGIHTVPHTVRGTYVENN